MAQVKICGIRDSMGLNAAVQGDARFIGLVFYPRSPRAVDLTQARTLLAEAPPGLRTVALCVDPDDALLRELAALNRLDMVQLHGAETPRRTAAIAAALGKPLMKALPVAQAEDFAAVADFAPLVAQFLFDARPPPGGLPGGNALAFDWRLLAGRTFPRPWMLAGGLTPGNVAEAIRISGAAMVDVSSGVEDQPGVKNPQKIKTFCKAAGAAR